VTIDSLENELNTLKKALFLGIGLVGLALLTLAIGLIYAKAPEGGWLFALGVGCILVMMLERPERSVDVDLM